VGPRITAGRLAIPAYAIDSGRDLQHSDDLFSDCLAQVLCRPLHWPAAVRAAVSGGAPGQILDYGPGIAVRAFTRDCLERDGHQVGYVTVRPHG
jgi:hypothetical protein